MQYNILINVLSGQHRGGGDGRRALAPLAPMVPTPMYIHICIYVYIYIYIYIYIYFFFFYQHNY